MVAWLNRTVVQGPRNGTTSHTVNFGWTATAGRFILIIANGSVTSTTPSGYTLPTNGSAVNNSGLYVWYKASAAGTETSFSTTHNASNYPVGFVIYEFPAGTTWKSAVAATNVARTDAGPNLTGLTGTNWIAGLVGQANATASAEAITWSGTPTPTEDFDINEVKVGTDGYNFSLCYVEASTATSFQPTGSASGSPNKEAITFALSVPAGGSSFSSSPALTGAGTVSTSVKAGTSAATPLSGAGTLATSVKLGTSATTSLNGVGVLSTTVKMGGQGSTSLGADGALSVTTSHTSHTVSLLSGSGTLVTNTTLAVQSATPLAAAGTLSASVRAAVAELTQLAGTGTLSVLAGASSVNMVALSGTGTLNRVTRLGAVAQPAIQLTGSGVLSVFTFVDTGPGELTAYVGNVPVVKLFLGLTQISNLT